jgi:hypothetical protein
MISKMSLLFCAAELFQMIADDYMLNPENVQQVEENIKLSAQNKHGRCCLVSSWLHLLTSLHCFTAGFTHNSEVTDGKQVTCRLSCWLFLWVDNVVFVTSSKLVAIDQHRSCTVFYNVVTFRFHWLRVNTIFLHHINILYIDSKIYVNELSVFLYGAVKLFIQEIWSLIRYVWICICTYDELKAVILAIVVWPGIMFQINVRM